MEMCKMNQSNDAKMTSRHFDTIWLLVDVTHLRFGGVWPERELLVSIPYEENTYVSLSKFYLYTWNSEDGIWKPR